MHTELWNHDKQCKLKEKMQPIKNSNNKDIYTIHLIVYKKKIIKGKIRSLIKDGKNPQISKDSHNLPRMNMPKKKTKSISKLEIPKFLKIYLLCCSQEVELNLAIPTTRSYYSSIPDAKVSRS